MKKDQIINLILNNYIPQDFDRLERNIKDFTDLKKELEDIAKNNEELFKKIYIDLLTDLKARAEQDDFYITID